jgi:hypothetical protein
LLTVASSIAKIVSRDTARFSVEPEATADAALRDAYAASRGGTSGSTPRSLLHVMITKLNTAGLLGCRVARNALTP